MCFICPVEMQFPTQKALTPEQWINKSQSSVSFVEFPRNVVFSKTFLLVPKFLKIFNHFHIFRLNLFVIFTCTQKSQIIALFILKLHRMVDYLSIKFSINIIFLTSESIKERENLTDLRKREWLTLPKITLSKSIKKHKKVKIRVEFTYGVITGLDYGIKEQTEGWLGFSVGQAS